MTKLTSTSNLKIVSPYYHWIPT